MQKHNWKVTVAFILMFTSALIYIINYLIFKNPHDIFFYMTIDIAFLPINVLFVTLLIDTLLSQREKKSMLDKLNMVIGTFFSEVGLNLLKSFNEYDKNLEIISDNLTKINDWSKKDYLKFKSNIINYESKIIINRDEEETLKRNLLGKRDFLLRLLENPNLLEHETFTELLRAVFHLTEEMANRESFENQPEADCRHIEIDIKRAYLLLVKEWLSYMEYLKNSYPYLYSLAVRQNPFNKNSTVTIS